jgi:hypothetical protein
LKAIIDERPNAVPVGVGNNSSGYDVSILVPSGNTSEIDWSDLGLGLDTTDGDGERNGNDNGGGDGNGEDGHGDSDSEGADDEGGNSDIDDVTMEKQVPSETPSLKTPIVTKRKATAVEAPETKTLKTSARAGKSTPTAVTASQRASKKPKTGIEKINAIAAKEEETTQKVLELKKLKVKGENDKVLAKIKAKAEVKMQQMKLRAELAQQKLDNDFRLQMARMGHAYSEAGSSGMVRSNTAPGSGYSDAGSVTPSTYSNETPQLDPSLEFFGQNSGYDFNQHFHD